MEYRQQSNVNSFLGSAFARVERALQNPLFEQGQRNLLSKTFDLYRERSAGNPYSDPIAIFYYVAKAWRSDLDEQAEHLAASCLLYVLALDLIDDVQDGDLDGKPHAQAGPAIATNSGLTLLFLGLEALTNAIDLETDAERRVTFLSLYNRISLLAVSGQHRDLMGRSASQSPEQVLAMQQAKTSSLALIAESAAIYAGCDEKALESYRQASECMVQMVQVVDDLRDIFGKAISPDLVSGKMTYPIACFFESATEEQKARLEAGLAAMPASMRQIRATLYEAGAVQRSADTVERFRLDCHRALAALGSAAPTHRIWLHLVDSLAGNLYEVSLVEESRLIYSPEGKWHETVRLLARDLVTNLAQFAPPALPALLTWHRPQWMYDPGRRVIFYPDLEGQAEEVLPLQSALMGVDDLATVRGVLEALAPVVMAHEYFHYWRDASSLLSGDAWYEEWVANRLAVAYVAAYHPELRTKTLDLANQVLRLHPEGISTRGQEILTRMLGPDFQPHSQPRGYEVDLSEMALIQLVMVTHLYREDLSLESEIARSLAVESGILSRH